jgi:hypothetical protein
MRSGRAIRSARSAGQSPVTMRASPTLPSLWRSPVRRRRSARGLPVSPEAPEVRRRGARPGPSRPRLATRSFRAPRPRAPAERAADRGGVVRTSVPTAQLRGRSHAPCRRRSRAGVRGPEVARRCGYALYVCGSHGSGSIVSIGRSLLIRGTRPSSRRRQTANGRRAGSSPGVGFSRLCHCKT